MIQKRPVGGRGRGNFPGKGSGQAGTGKRGAGQAGKGRKRKEGIKPKRKHRRPPIRPVGHGPFPKINRLILKFLLSGRPVTFEDRIYQPITINPEKGSVIFDLYNVGRSKKKQSLGRFEVDSETIKRK